MKARLVITNRKTRKSVWRLLSVVNSEPRGSGGVSVFPGGAPREWRDNQRYHAGYPLPPFGTACPGALPRAADLRTARQSPLVEMQRLGHAAGAAGNTGEGIVGAVNRHLQLCLQPPIESEQEGAASGKG